MSSAKLALAVVGRVNKGKSSIIATLAEDERVAVSPLPGTTRDVTEYPVEVDGVALFTLIDTPGFEQASRMLALLDEPGSVGLRELVQRPEVAAELEEECRLLAPILAGAAILYVVDGDKPYRDNYRAEMQLLAATRQPRIAIINRLGNGEHRGAWQAALAPYFQVVEVFDAQKATLEERIRLLHTVRTIDASFQEPVRRAVDALLAEDHRRTVESAQIISELLAHALTFTLQTRGEDSIEPKRLERQYHDGLRSMEREARDRLAHLYRHDHATWREAQELARPIFGEDLFAERTWASLGLSATQLLATYAVSGAVTGGLIDAGVGAASFGAGAALGALLGVGATALHLQQRFAVATRIEGSLGRLRNAVTGGPTYRVGPLKHPNFPFILLDRALRYHRAVRDRAHALTAAGREIEGAPQSNLSERLSTQERKVLVTLFRKLQRRRDSPELRSALFRAVRQLLEQESAA